MATSTGLSPKDPNKYLGPNVYTCSVVNRQREPTGADYRQPETGKLYPIDCYWIVGNDPTTGLQGDLWYLSKIVANVAYWVKLSSGGVGPFLDIVVPLGVSPIVPDGTGTVTFTSTGGTLAITGSAADPNNHFINFDLTGGGVGIDAINVDAHTVPGTDPVVADGTGQITVTATQVAAGTVGATAIRTDSLAANTYTIEIQRSASAASSSVNNNGIASYNSADLNVDSNAYVSLNAITSAAYSNIGISYSAGTFTVSGFDGTALSASNPAVVWLQDRSNPGRLKKYVITANQTFTDGAAGTTDNMRWGLTTGVNASVDVPFFLYAVGNDAQDTISFMISRIPHAKVAPAAASIGKSGAVVNVGQGDFFSLANVTVADYDANPCLVIGSFRMQFVGSTDSWTVQTLVTSDGIGQFQAGKLFSYPRGQFGSATGKYFLDNGGTAPDDAATGTYFYTIDINGLVQINISMAIDVAGVGAVEATLAIPLHRTFGVVNGSGYWVGAGGSPGSTTVSQFAASVVNFLTVYNTYIGGIGVQSSALANTDLGISAMYHFTGFYNAST